VCRLLALLAKEDLHLDLFLSALKSAAKHDRHLDSGGSHGDGWGIAAVSGSGLLLYKSGKPMWEDVAVNTLQQLLRSPLAMIAHARRVSFGMPRGVGAAHPFPVNLGDGGLLVVAQNGVLNVNRLLKVIERKMSPGNVDSYLYSVALAERLERTGSLAAALESLHRELEEEQVVTKMANTVVLLLRRADDSRSAQVRAGNSWGAQVGVVKHVVDEGSAVYGELYKLESPGFFVAASITVAENLGGELPLEPLEGNAVIVVDENLQVSHRPL